MLTAIPNTWQLVTVSGYTNYLHGRCGQGRDKDKLCDGIDQAFLCHILEDESSGRSLVALARAPGVGTPHAPLKPQGSPGYKEAPTGKENGGSAVD